MIDPKKLRPSDQRKLQRVNVLAAIEAWELYDVSKSIPRATVEAVAFQVVLDAAMSDVVKPIEHWRACAADYLRRREQAQWRARVAAYRAKQR